MRSTSRVHPRPRRSTARASKPVGRRRHRTSAAGRFIFLVAAIFAALVLWHAAAVGFVSIGRLLSIAGSAGQSVAPAALGTRTYVVRRGDTIDTIAVRFGVSPAVLARLNGISRDDTIEAGQRLLLPTFLHLRRTRRLIEYTARRLGIDPALADALAWQESGFDQNMRSNTGAVGVMQIEPGTVQLVEEQTGRHFNAAAEGDNVQAGLSWLAYLLRFYGGDRPRALAAYYEGQGNLQTYGYLPGTRQYVADVMALRARFAVHQ